MNRYSILCMSTLLLVSYSGAGAKEVKLTKQQVINAKCQQECKQGEICCVIPEYNDDDTDTFDTYCAKTCYVEDPEIS